MSEQSQQKILDAALDCIDAVFPIEVQKQDSEQAKFKDQLLGKRSPRWADKPSNVLAISVGKDGLTEQDVALLQSLGMAQ